MAGGKTMLDHNRRVLASSTASLLKSTGLLDSPRYTETRAAPCKSLRQVGYKRLTQVTAGSTVLRTFMYDTNTLDGTYSGSYTAGRLVAVQHAAFTPPGY